MHAHARCAGCRAGGAAYILVRQVVDDAQVNRLALVGAQLAEGVVDPLQPLVVGFRRCLWPVERGKDSQPFARALLQPIPADRRDEHVACDRV